MPTPTAFASNVGCLERRLERYAKLHATDAQFTPFSSMSGTYSDPVFSSGDAAFGEKAAEIGEKTWGKIYWFEMPGGYLIKDGITTSDVEQGSLGDCWLLASILVCCQQPRLLKRFFPEEAGSNRVVVRLHVLGKPIYIPIDKRIAIKPDEYKRDESGDYVLNAQGQKLVDTWTPICAMCKDPRETWLAMIEKAAAKLYGGYDKLCGGKPSVALAMLTGGVPLRSPPYLDDPKRLFGFMRMVLKNGRGVFAGGTDEEECGLISDHSYGVLDVISLSGDNIPPKWRPYRTTLRLVKLMNPWGSKGEYTGHFTDSDSAWGEDLGDGRTLRDLLGHTSANDGVFYMEFYDYAKYFTDMEGCLFPDQFPHSQRMICHIASMVEGNSSVWLDVPASAESFPDGKRFVVIYEVTPKAVTPVERIPTKIRLTIVTGWEPNPSRTNWTDCFSEYEYFVIPERFSKVKCTIRIEVLAGFPEGVTDMGVLTVMSEHDFSLRMGVKLETIPKGLAWYDPIPAGENLYHEFSDPAEDDWEEK
eukprot:gnl/Carplike_NY0171/4878_a6649_329.p1 GENE.gnl/Carplike_NY0171/4878_a6649_329~~gnl/Carplike_NY0171/4878_a6649_329.p1  ORF type:complete len:556 (-),score=161.06 gnl/Carplike_NY0171/4878_a6649_329:167-1756(-)